MPTMRPCAAPPTSAPVSQPTSGLPLVRPRTHRALGPRVDQARRALWHAFQRGALSEDESLGTTRVRWRGGRACCRQRRQRSFGLARLIPRRRSARRRRSTEEQAGSDGHAPLAMTGRSADPRLVQAARSGARAYSSAAPRCSQARPPPRAMATADRNASAISTPSSRWSGVAQCSAWCSISRSAASQPATYTGSRARRPPARPRLPTPHAGANVSGRRPSRTANQTRCAGA